MAGSGPSLFVTYSGVSGGAERFLVEIVGGLDRPAVIACPPGALASAARERSLPVVELPARPLELRGRAVRSAAQLAGHARDIRRLVHSLDPELLFAWGARSALAASLLRSPVPLAVRQHELIPGPAIGRALRLALRRADRVIVNSDAVRRDLGVAADVIWPGVDLDRFCPPATAPQGPPRALWLGALTAVKRPELALEVAAALPELELVVAGAPLGEDGRRLQADVERRAGALGDRVRLTGALEDPVEELRAAHLLLHTADREAFGISIAEALACGTPVVAPDAAGPAEIIDASCGRLFAAGDSASAAAAVRETLLHRERLSAGARVRAEARLGLDRAQQAFGRVVSELAAGRAGHDGGELSLVAVAHNSRSALGVLLASAARHLPGAEIVVVDSGSSDGSSDVARGAGASVIELENVGFGRSANAGVTRATRPVTVVANADIELVDESLAWLAAELLRPGAPERIMAPALVLGDGSRQDSAQHEPATLPLALFAIAPRTLAPWHARRARRVGWAVGACVAGRTETLRRLGPFDPDVFMYGEDLDLGLRAADAGVETWFFPQARVLHGRAHATGPAFGGEPVGLKARRRREVVGARRGRARLLADDALQALTFTNRIAWKTLLRRDNTRERSQLAALREARRSR